MWLTPITDVANLITEETYLKHWCDKLETILSQIINVDMADLKL